MIKKRKKDIGYKKVYNKKGQVIVYIKPKVNLSPIFDMSEIFTITESNITKVTFDGGAPGYVDIYGNVFTRGDRFVGSIKNPKRVFIPMSIAFILIIFLTLTTYYSTIAMSKVGMHLLEPEYPEITVYSAAENIEWSEENNFNILENSYGIKSLYPGSTGAYTFVVNNKNKRPILHNIIFSDINQNNVPMRYRLKSNNIYICEDWLTLSEISVSSIYLLSETKATYHIEWLWPPDLDDEADSSIGQDETAAYTIQISVNAELVL